VDETTGLSYGLDMLSLIHDESLDPAEFVGQYIQQFAKDVQEQVNRML